MSQIRVPYVKDQCYTSTVAIIPSFVLKAVIKHYCLAFYSLNDLLVVKAVSTSTTKAHDRTQQ
jgi:hypothetical protein